MVMNPPQPQPQPQMCGATGTPEQVFRDRLGYLGPMAGKRAQQFAQAPGSNRVHDDGQHAPLCGLRSVLSLGGRAGTCWSDTEVR